MADLATPTSGMDMVDTVTVTRTVDMARHSAVMGTEVTVTPATECAHVLGL